MKETDTGGQLGEARVIRTRGMFRSCLVVSLQSVESPVSAFERWKAWLRKRCKSFFAQETGTLADKHMTSGHPQHLFFFLSEE